MSDRLLKILAGVLILLLVAYVVARFAAIRAGAPQPTPFDLEAASTLALDSVVIAAPQDTIRLRAGPRWTVNGYDAVSDAGTSLQQALAQAQVGQLVSRNPDNHGRLGVTAEGARRLTLYAGGTARLSLLFGGRAGSWDEAYARRDGGAETYIMQGSLVSLAQRAVDDWRDRTVLSASADGIQRIELTYGDTSFALARDSAAWRLEPSGAAANGTEVSTLLGQLAELRAVSFAPDSVADTLTWEPVTAVVRVLGPGGAALGALEFLDRGDAGYYVRRAGTPVVYTVSSYSGRQILKRESALAAAPPDSVG